MRKILHHLLALMCLKPDVAHKDRVSAPQTEGVKLGIGVTAVASVLTVDVQLMFFTGSSECVVGVYLP